MKMKNEYKLIRGSEIFVWVDTPSVYEECGLKHIETNDIYLLEIKLVVKSIKKFTSEVLNQMLDEGEKNDTLF